MCKEDKKKGIKQVDLTEPKKKKKEGGGIWGFTFVIEFHLPLHLQHPKIHSQNTL